LSRVARTFAIGASVLAVATGLAFGLFLPSIARAEDPPPTTVPTPTLPTPDPAPPKPTPKPAPKTAPSPTPRPTYTAPRRTFSAPTYTPAAPSKATARRAKPRVARKHKTPRPKKAAVTTSTPVETTPTPAVLVPVPLGAKRVPRQAGGDAAIRSILFIGGISFAALLFLLAATVPGTPAGFTPVGRVVIEHQQDFVLTGVAAFVITVFVYLLTGHGL
jgi:hypothetical protein